MTPADLSRSRSMIRSFPSRLEEADVAGSAIRDFLKLQGISATFELELVARECINNAIVHGNRNNPGKYVFLEIRVGRRWILIRVKDEGGGFDWRRRAQGTFSDWTATSGRGLPILAHYTSRVSFNRKGNQVSLWIRKESFKGNRT
jgi:serine/threonine-protein kinase RsbW